MRSTTFIRYSPQIDSDSGVIVPLSALMLTVMISLVGLAYYILGYGASAEMSRNAAKFSVLAALEAYMGQSCESNLGVAVCHSAKMDAALTRANEIAVRNSAGLATVSFSQSSANGSTYSSLLVPLRWYDKQPNTTSNPCPSGYPCGVPVSSSELANAMTLRGRAMDRLSALLSFGLAGRNSEAGVIFSTTAVASPMHAMFVVDVSSSIAEDTHLGPEDVALRNADQYRKSHPDPYWSTYFSYLAKSNAVVTTTHADFVPDSEGTQEVDDTWNNTPAKRPENDAGTSVDHYQDDYRLVFSYAETIEGRDAYQYKDRHPEPGQDTIVAIEHLTREPNTEKSNQIIPATVLPILLDKYRSGSYAGPEPLNSIAKGVKTFLEQMKNRQVAGDKAGLVFASDKLTWNRVVNLSSDIEYLNTLLDFETGAKDMDALSGQRSVDPSSVENEPTWVQTGFFTKPNTNTDLYGALRMASNQLATEGDLSLVNSNVTRPAIPSVDFVVLFTDGLGNCAPSSGMTGCSNTYTGVPTGSGGYAASKTAIDTLVYDNFFKTKIPLHVVLAGKQSGPHIIKISVAGTNGAVSSCLTEAQVRNSAGSSSPYYSVDQQPICTTESGCQDKWNRRFVAPFTLAIKDWYDVVVRTGGVFAPLLSSGEGCVTQDPNIGCQTGVTTRYSSDPSCRTPGAQVQEYLDQILRGSNAFTIVETK